MTQVFQKLSHRYANALEVLIGLAVVSSILLCSGCGTSSRDINIPATPPRDTTPPTVRSFSPAAAAVNVNVDANVIANFSEAMDAATVSASTVELRAGSSSVIIPATVAYDAVTFTVVLNPTNSLAPGTTYTVRVRGGSADPRVKDQAGNALATDATWTFKTEPLPLTVFATSPSDTTTGVPTGIAPIVFFTKPLDPTTVNTSTVLLTDAANALVPLNVSSDANEFTLRFVPTALLQPEQKYTVTLKGGSASPRIIDREGVSLAADFVFSFTTAAAEPAITTFSIFDPTDTPVNKTDPDTTAIELGLKFSSNVDGFVTGVRFYKGDATNGGVHVGHLWTDTGTPLGSVAFTDESASGWQQATFLTPIPVTANTTYVVSYFAPQGHYSGDNFYFGPTGPFPDGKTNGPLHALGHIEAGGSPDGELGGNGNGVFFAGPQGGFPTSSFRATNYWVDVVFVRAAEPPRVVSVDPAPGTADVSTGVAPTARFSEPLDPTTVTTDNIELRNTANREVPVTVSYDPSSFTIRITPKSALQPESAYVVFLESGPGGITDSTGVPLAAPNGWAFFTAKAAPPAPTFSIFAPASTPIEPINPDPQAMEVGLKFRSNTDGFINGVRFYKGGPENGGTHVGHLWTDDGKLLGSVTFTNETDSGWQQAFFSKPISITANTTYVISYFAPQGNYAKDDYAFDVLGGNNGPLRALSSSEAGAERFGNGVYLKGAQGGFPVFSNLASNYWVDVIFAPVQQP
jgi:uncharacterized protein DUF4082/Big-like domain-containing protein